MPSDVLDKWRSGTSTGSVLDKYRGQGQEGSDGGGGVLDTVLDVVSTPGRMTAGAIRAGLKGDNVIDAITANRPTIMGGTREDDFDDILADQGVPDTLGRRLGGLALDVVVDPLNLVDPIAPIAKGARALGVTKALGKVADAVKDTRLARDIGERFIPNFNLGRFKTVIPAGAGATQDISYSDLRRLHQSTKDFLREEAGQKVLDLFKGITNDQAYDIAKALDEGIPLMDPKIDSLRASAAKLFADQFQKEVAAGVMPASAQRLDYVTHLLTRDAKRDPVMLRELSGKNPFQVRKELSFEDGVKAGVFEPDIRKIMAQRLAVGDRAIENQKFFQQTAQHFGVKVLKGQPAPPGFVRPELAAEPGLKKALKGTYLPSDIARNLEKMIELPAQPGAISQLATGATALWKGYATRANPGFHARNMVSNMVQTWFGGLGDTGTKILDPAVVLAKHADAAAKLADPAKIGDIGRYTGDEIRDAIGKYGITSSHQSSFNELDEVIEGEIKHAGQGFVRRNLNPLDKRNLLLREGAKAGSAIENTSRLALFLDQLEKGSTLEQAALHVRKYLFDYSELTPFERKVRDRAFPFYTWLRKNIPLQIENSVKGADKMAAIGKTYDAIEDAGQDRGVALSPDQIPDWMQRDYLQVPVRTDQGGSVFVDPSLPIKDLNRITQPGVLESLNPLIRIPTEVAMNRQFFTNSPIYDDRLGPMGDMKKAPGLVQALEHLAPGMVPGVAEGKDGSAQIPALADYVLRQLPPVTQAGKLATAVVNEEPADVGGVDLDIPALAGVPTRVVTKEQAAKQQKMKRNGEKAKRRAEQKEKRGLKKADVTSLYEKYRSQP